MSLKIGLLCSLSGLSYNYYLRNNDCILMFDKFKHNKNVKQVESLDHWSGMSLKFMDRFIIHSHYSQHVGTQYTILAKRNNTHCDCHCTMAEKRSCPLDQFSQYKQFNQSFLAAMGLDNTSTSACLELEAVDSGYVKHHHSIIFNERNQSVSFYNSEIPVKSKSWFY